MAGLLLELLQTAGLPIDIDWLTDSIAGATIQLFLQWGITLFLAFLYLRGRGYYLSPDIFGFRLRRFGWGMLYLAGILFLYWGLTALYILLLERFGIGFDPAQDLTQPYGISAAGLITALVQVAIIVPIVEEFFFRGIIYQGLENRWGFLPAAVTSAAIFAVVHIDPIIFFPIFLLGFGFASLFYLTRSLWPSITGHFIINFIGVLAQFESYLAGFGGGG